MLGLIRHRDLSAPPRPDLLSPPQGYIPQMARPGRPRTGPTRTGLYSQWTAESLTVIPRAARRERLRTDMRRLLDETPVEPGLLHPVEAVLAETLRRYSTEAPAWITDFLRSCDGAGTAADLLTCLARVPRDLTTRWTGPLLQWALASPDPRLRLAAVRAAELWRDRPSVDLLRLHVDTDRVLADYVGRVLRQVGAVA